MESYIFTTRFCKILESYKNGFVIVSKSFAVLFLVRLSLTKKGKEQFVLPRKLRGASHQNLKMMSILEVITFWMAVYYWINLII